VRKDCATAPGDLRPGITGPVRGDLSNANPRPRMSPDGKWMAFIDNYNVAIRPFGGDPSTNSGSPRARSRADKRIALSTDGSEGNYYDGASIVWSPDSTKVAAYRVRPGYRRLVHYVSSSPEDQLQPEHWAIQYAKPGDQLDLEQPVLFDVRSQKQIVVDARLFPNPFDLSDLVWRKDSRGFTFEYNQRGHQVYRVIEVDAQTGVARAVISEEPKTFFYYNRSAATLQAGKRYLHDRTVETLGLLYAMHWPYYQYQTARGARRTPLHDRLLAAGACMGETAGWERPNWDASPGSKPG